MKDTLHTMDEQLDKLEKSQLLSIGGTCRKVCFIHLPVETN